jgi:hypothetical protein
MEDVTIRHESGDMKGLEPLKDAPVAPAHAIASVALNMAMKYHDIQMVKDGALYQQYKLEGKNFRDLHLDDVFETAIKIEMHLLGSSDRIAKIVVDAIAFGVERDEAAENADGEIAPEDAQGQP